MEAALETVANNAGAIIKLAGPEGKFLVDGLTALTTSLGTTLEEGHLKAIFSSKQLLDLTRVVFGTVALHSEALLGGSNDPQNSVLAKIIAAVAEALKADPKRIISGDGLLQIIQTALTVGAAHAEKILPLDPSKPLTSPLHQILKGLLESAPQLAGSLHSGNFPAVFEKVLMQYLLGILKSTNTNEIFETAKTILIANT